MDAIEELISSYHDAIGLGECEITDNARTELAALREADIRTLEHCGDCGALMVVDYDAPEGETENHMYCPVCLCRVLEQANGVWRSQAAMLDDYAETIRRHEITIEAQARWLEHDIDALTGIISGWRDYANGHYCRTYNLGMTLGLNTAADELEAYASGMKLRLAAHPAQKEQAE